jgi:hypothetical protein
MTADNIRFGKMAAEESSVSTALTQISDISSFTNYYQLENINPTS